MYLVRPSLPTNFVSFVSYSGLSQAFFSLDTLGTPHTLCTTSSTAVAPHGVVVILAVVVDVLVVTTLDWVAVITKMRECVDVDGGERCSSRGYNFLNVLLISEIDKELVHHDPNKYEEDAKNEREEGHDSFDIVLVIREDCEVKG